MKSSDNVNKEVFARLIGVNKSFNGNESTVYVLKDITFEAIAGEMVLLLGPSGSGKTTFLTLLGGMQRPSGGEVYLFGKRLEAYSARELQKLRAERLGFIFQTFKLIESLSVLDNILLVLRFAGTTGTRAKETAMNIIREMGLTHLSYSLPGSISQGEKQRVAIARALVNDANLVIADEPTGSLSSDQGMRIVQLLRESVTGKKRCVVVASHDERIAHYADRVIRLRDGKVI